MPRYLKKRTTRRKASRKQRTKSMKYRGGDNGMKSLFQEATDASCVLIPKSVSRSK